MAETRHQPELTEVRPAHRLDLQRLAEYFAGHLPQFAGALTARQFKDGQSNPTYLMESGVRQFVLRKKPPGELLPGAHRIEREFHIISALAAHGVPVSVHRGQQRAGEVVNSYADITRAEAVLGWRPQVELSEGLRRTVKGLLQRLASEVQ